jgi:membrane-associated phospholipid phosphatase
MNLRLTANKLSLWEIFFGVFIIVLSLVSMNLWDQRLSQVFQSGLWGPLRPTAEVLTDLGLGWPYFALSLFFYFFARRKLKKGSDHPSCWQDVKWWSRFRFIYLCAMGLGVQTIKITLGRQRPHISLDQAPHIFTPASWHWDSHSFPSGHAQVIFVVATVLSLAYPRWKIPLLLAASVIALTRLVVVQHFLSDILFGSALGYFGTRWLYSVLVSKNLRLQKSNTIPAKP